MDSGNTESSSLTPLGVSARTALGAYLVLLPILLGYLVYSLWPVTGDDGKFKISEISLFGDLIAFTPSVDVRFILLVMVVGAIGSYVHGATSFADFVGNRRIYSSWIWWYVLRVFVGLALALIFYFVMRGGLISGDASADDVNPFGIAAISGLVGMFSKQATDKLAEVAGSLFQTAEPDLRKDKMEYPEPAAATLKPDTVAAGSGETVVTVTGHDFVPESRVRFNGVDRPTTFVNDKRLTVKLPPTDLAAAGEAQLTVFNPAPGGGTSAALNLRIQ